MDISFSVTASSESPTRTVVKARNFEMIVDEPPSLGGDDKGANPVEYVLAALAGCLNVVGNLVAKEMGIKIDSIQMDISGDLNPAKFQGKSDAERAGYKKIQVAMKVKSDADEETLAKWKKAVEARCPVSDNIANPTPVEITLSKM